MYCCFCKFQSMQKVKKILMIDEEVLEHEVFEMALRHVNADIKCEFARTTKQAFDLLEKMGDDLPGMIFLEVSMTEHSGHEGLRSLKSSEKFAQIPVVVYTGENFEDQKHILRTLGASYFLKKPFYVDLVLVLKFLILAEVPNFKELERVTRYLIKF